MMPEPEAAEKPREATVVDMLSEIEAARLHAARPLLLWLLPSLALGVALLAYAGVFGFREFAGANRQLAEMEEKIRAQETEIAGLKERTRGGATLARAAFDAIDSADKRKLAADALASNPELAAKTPRVSIYVQQERGRPLAEKGASALADVGFIVPGVESTREEVANNQVRYYWLADAGPAQQVVDVLAERGVSDIRTNFSENRKITPGQLDVMLTLKPPPIPTPRPSPTTTPSPAVKCTPDPNGASAKAYIISKPEPTYTEDARKNNISGTVKLGVTLNASGNVTDIKVIEGLPHGLTEKAVEAARRIKFRPAQENGCPASKEIQLEYNFNIYTSQ